MTDAETLTPADPSELAYALVLAPRFEGGKRSTTRTKSWPRSSRDGSLALRRAGFVVMKRPREVGAAALGKGFEG
jgi:hypothetical protein